MLRPRQALPQPRRLGEQLLGTGVLEQAQTPSKKVVNPPDKTENG
jgi:hypothetical protein